MFERRLCLFFFFQAEDGIRDIGVTGVQTCALPISLTVPIAGAALLGLAVSVALWWLYFDVVAPVAERVLTRSQGVDRVRLARDSFRSEERRVGKECRSRWSPYH